MQIMYDAKTDLLYFRLDSQKQQVVNKRRGCPKILFWTLDQAIKLSV